jgi:hypothetical protein
MAGDFPLEQPIYHGKMSLRNRLCNDGRNFPTHDRNNSIAAKQMA